jgi:hypothetical protein
MPNETARAKLFGPTPGEVRQRRNQERQQISTGWAQLQPFAGAVKASANAGSAFGDVLGAAMGMQDPAMMRAMAVEKVKSDVMALGLDYSDPEQRKQYLQEVQQRFSDIGEFDMAENARQIAIEDDMRERQMLVTEQKADTAAEEARIKGVNAAVPDKNEQITLVPNTATRADDPGAKTYNLRDPDQLKAYNKAVESGKYKDANSLPGSGTKNITNLNTVDTNRAVNETVVDPVKQVMAKGSASRDQRNLSIELKNRMENGNFRSGTASELRQWGARALEFMGVSEATLESIQNDPSDASAMQAMHNAMVASMLRMEGVSGARMSQKQIELFEKAGPQLWMTPAGQNLVNEVLLHRANHNIRNEKALVDIMRRRGKDTDLSDIWGDYLDYLDNNPYEMEADFAEEVNRGLNTLKRAKEFKAKGQSVSNYVNVSKNENRMKIGSVYEYNGILVEYEGYINDDPMQAILRPVN